MKIMNIVPIVNQIISNLINNMEYTTNELLSGIILFGLTMILWVITAYILAKCWEDKKEK
jgi:hypothetical protein